MKKLLFAAAGLSAIAVAAPASAQYYPGRQPAPYGYNQPYGQAYGYNNNQQGLVRSYLVRADQIRRQVERLDGRRQPAGEAQPAALVVVEGGAAVAQRVSQDLGAGGVGHVAPSGGRGRGRWPVPGVRGQ